MISKVCKDCENLCHVIYGRRKEKMYNCGKGMFKLFIGNWNRTDIIGCSEKKVQSD